MLRWTPLLLAVPVLLFGCDTFEGKSCTMMACHSGVSVNFAFTRPGSYVFDVTVDGEKTTCRTTLPLPASTTPGAACDRNGVRLGLVGTAFFETEQSISGLELDTTTAKSITLRATRDGGMIGESTVAPPYKVGPPPNGPECDPPGCTFASYSFP
jgi:hypothetical protein